MVRMTTFRGKNKLTPGRGLARNNVAVSVRGNDQVLVTRVGLTFPTSMSYDDWTQAGKRISAVADSSSWCLGDWVIFGQNRYTDRYRRAIDAAGLDYQTIRNYAWVARSFEMSRRRDDLSFQHHAEVAALPPHEQDYWLNQAAKYGWSRNQLRQYVRGSRGGSTEPRSTMALPQLGVAYEQINRWREAARRMDRSLESWIIEQLDAAASEVLGTGVSRSIEGRRERRSHPAA